MRLHAVHRHGIVRARARELRKLAVVRRHDVPRRKRMLPSGVPSSSSAHEDFRGSTLERELGGAKQSIAPESGEWMRHMVQRRITDDPEKFLQSSSL